MPCIQLRIADRPFAVKELRGEYPATGKGALAAFHARGPLPGLAEVVLVAGGPGEETDITDALKGGLITGSENASGLRQVAEGLNARSWSAGERSGFEQGGLLPPSGNTEGIKQHPSSQQEE